MPESIRKTGCEYSELFFERTSHGGSDMIIFISASFSIGYIFDDCIDKVDTFSTHLSWCWVLVKDISKFQWQQFTLVKISGVGEAVDVIDMPNKKGFLLLEIEATAVRKWLVGWHLQWELEWYVI